MSTIIRTFITLFILSILGLGVSSIYSCCTASGYTVSDYEIKKKQYPRLSFDLYCMIKQAAAVERIDDTDLFQLVRYESNFTNTALSKAGAMGLTQLMPVTAIRLKVNPWQPYDNLRGGARHFRMCLSLSHGNKYEAFCKYNSGHNRRVYPTETHRYAALCTGVIAVAMR